MSVASSRRRRSDDKANNLGIDVCDICYMCFHSGTSLSLHKRIHWRDCIFDCSNCNKRFSSLINLREHQKVHVETASPLYTPTKKNVETETLRLFNPKNKNVDTEKAIKSSLISIKSTSNPRKVKKRAPAKDEFPSEISPNILPAKTKLILHHKRHYYVNKDKAVTKMAGTMLSCLLCSASFPGDRALTKHIREEHRGQDMSIIDTIVPTDTIRCENCAMVFDSEKALLRHAKTCYDEPRDSDDDEDDSEDDAKVVNSRGVWAAKPFQCPKCDQILNNRYSLGGHMSSMHNPNRKRQKTRRKKIYPVKKPKNVYPTKEAPEEVDVAEESPEEVVFVEERLKKVLVPEETPEEVDVTEETPEEVLVPEETPEEVLVPEETPEEVLVPEKNTKEFDVAEETPKVVSCPDCKKFSTDDHHCQVHEEKVNSSHFECKSCHESFSKQYECALHMKNKCRVKSPQKGELALKCQKCHQGFKKMKQYELHKMEKLCHLAQDIKQSVVILEKLDEKVLKRMSELSATVAGMEKSKAPALVNKCNKPFECPDCGKKCLSKMSLGVHRKQHRKRQELKATNVSKLAKTGFDNDNEVSVSKKTLAIVEDIATPVITEVKEKDNKLIEDTPVEFGKSNKNTTENLELVGLEGIEIGGEIEVKMEVILNPEEVDKPIHKALPGETPKQVEEDISTPHAVSVASKSTAPYTVNLINLPGPDSKETSQKQPTLLSNDSSISVLNGFSPGEVKDTPENASNSNTAISEEQSTEPLQLSKDISENAKIVDVAENKSAILNGDASEDTKIIPQMNTDTIDKENSELRGIIDFINNDCTE